MRQALLKLRFVTLPSRGALLYMGEGDCAELQGEAERLLCIL